MLTYCSHWTRTFYHRCVTPPPRAWRTTEKLGPSNLFWPWAVFSRSDCIFSRSDFMLDHHMSGSQSTRIGRVPVMLNRGEGVQGEPELLACTCQASSVLLAQARYRVEAVLMCALGCGEALKDGGSGICMHADEVPCVFASWLSRCFV